MCISFFLENTSQWKCETVMPFLVCYKIELGVSSSCGQKGHKMKDKEDGAAEIKFLSLTMYTFL